MLNKWNIKKSHEQVINNDVEFEEIELSYDHEVDLFELKTKSWDQDSDSIYLYPKDLPNITSLFNRALKEATNAGWWKKE